MIFFELFALLGLAHAKSYCQRGQPCWPTTAEVDAFKAKLDPEQPRKLVWDGKPHPRVCSVPIGSPDDQPLYGLGGDLDALYYDPNFDTTKPCFTQPANERRPICFVAIRNNPLQKITPGFVVWALTAQHVQHAVIFAKDHNLCIMVAGTGHDFLNRHSCTDGMFIRTTLLKDIEYDIEDKKGFGWKDGNIKFGSGTTFSEAHKAASDNDRFVASGWAITVGIAGWSIGGGHGPFGQAKGLGADNILEVEIVTANGTLLTANANENSDLYWALRGGGGSTWGIMTSLTLRAHALPADGITRLFTQYSGDFCQLDAVDTFTDAYLKWSQKLDHRWSGLVHLGPKKGDYKCGGGFFVVAQYVFLGSKDEAQPIWNELTNSMPNGINIVNSKVDHSPNYWGIVSKYDLEPITPWPMAETGIVSVLVDRSKVEGGDLGRLMKQQYQRCKSTGVCPTHQLYHDITGAKDSPREMNVSVSPSFRTAMFHYVFEVDEGKETYYNTLGDHAYLSESAWNMDDWQERLWGPNYPKLLSVKKKYDPENVFWCRHCVGDSNTITKKISPVEERLLRVVA